MTMHSLLHHRNGSTSQQRDEPTSTAMFRRGEKMSSCGSVCSDSLQFDEFCNHLRLQTRTETLWLLHMKAVKLTQAMAFHVLWVLFLLTHHWSHHECSRDLHAYSSKVSVGAWQYLQWTTIGPAVGGLDILTRRMNDSSPVAWYGTPWSGQPVKWNCFTSRTSLKPLCEMKENIHKTLTSWKNYNQIYQVIQQFHWPQEVSGH